SSSCRRAPRWATRSWWRTREAPCGSHSTRGPVTSSRAEAAERAGFALIESIVALAIIGTFAVAVLATLGAQTRAADRAATLLTAQALAEDRQMVLELLDHADLVSVPDSVASGTFPPPFEFYSWTARVERVDDEDDLFV